MNQLYRSGSLLNGCIVCTTASVVVLFLSSCGDSPADKTDESNTQKVVEPETTRAPPRDDWDMAMLDALSARYDTLRHGVRSPAEDARTRAAEIAEYVALLEAHPRWPELQYRLASQRIAYHRLEPHRFDELIKARDRLKALDRQLEGSDDIDMRASARFQLGRCLKHIADHMLEYDAEKTPRSEIDAVYAESIVWLKRALEVDPDRIDALGEIVLIDYTLDDIPAAVALIREHLPRVKDAAIRGKLQEMYGAALIDVDRTDEAIDAFEKAIELNRASPGSYLHMASIHAGRGNTAGQRAWLEKGAAAIPDFVTAHLRLGYLHMTRRDYATSIISMENALAVPPERAVVIGMRPSPALYRNDLYSQAAASLAWLYLQTGKLDRAEKMIERAAQLGPVDGHLNDTRAMIHHARGETARAIEMLSEIVAKDDLPGAHYHLAVIYAERKDYAKARRALDAALAGDRYFFNRPEAMKLREQIVAKNR